MTFSGRVRDPVPGFRWRRRRAAGARRGCPCPRPAALRPRHQRFPRAGRGRREPRRPAGAAAAPGLKRPKPPLSRGSRRPTPPRRPADATSVTAGPARSYVTTLC